MSMLQAVSSMAKRQTFDIAIGVLSFNELIIFLTLYDTLYCSSSGFSKIKIINIDLNDIIFAFYSYLD